MTTAAPAASTDGHRATLLQREVDDLRGKLGALLAAAKRAASDMERAAILIGGNYLGHGYAHLAHEIEGLMGGTFFEVPVQQPA